MPTNFPSGLDTATELGPTFINDVAVTDQARQIDATLRTNMTDAMFAVQARVGITNSTVTSSLSWATLSAGGTDNLGLRFAGSSTTWPGAVGEDGVFLVSTTGYPAFHRAGEAVGTFYYLTGITSMLDLQNSYDGGNTIATSGGNDIDFSFGATENFALTHTANSRTIISGSAFTATNGLLDINFTGIGVTGAMAVNILSENSTNNQEVGCCYSTMDNNADLADTEIVYGYAAALDMSGDGPGAGLALGAGFYAINAVFSGANNYESAGLLVDSTFDWGLYSNSKIRVNASARAQEIDSDPAVSDGSLVVANAASNASSLLQGYDGTIAAIGTTAVKRLDVAVDGSTDILADSADVTLYAGQDGAGGLLELYDTTNTATRTTVAKDGAIVTSVSAASTSPVLTLGHGAATEPFLSFNGTYNATAANGNITDENGAGAVVGPQGGVGILWSGTR